MSVALSIVNGHSDFTEKQFLTCNFKAVDVTTLLCYNKL